MPKLSIIVPIYNVEKYLRECLDSLINQTLKDIEIICVNDGSTDSSPLIIEEYATKDKRIKVLNKKNGGLSSARNAGIEIANGEYFAFVDGDDYVDTNTYEYVLNYTKMADLICFGIEVFADTKDKIINEADIKYYKIKYNGLLELTDEIIFENDVSSCNKIFKKEIIHKNNIVFPNGLNNEDAEFYCKYISCVKNAYYIDKYFYHYRRSNNSIMADLFSGSDKAIHHLYIIDNIFDFWLKNGFLHKHKNLFINFFISFLDFAYRNSTSNIKKKVLNVALSYSKKFNKELDNNKLNRVLRKFIINKVGYCKYILLQITNILKLNNLCI